MNREVHVRNCEGVGVKLFALLDFDIPEYHFTSTQIAPYYVQMVHLYVASAFPLPTIREVLAWGSWASQPDSIWSPRDWMLKSMENLIYTPICAIFSSARRIGFLKRVVWEILLGHRSSKTSLGQNQLWMRHNLGPCYLTGAVGRLWSTFN
jgi:hypothetical protein